VFSVSGGSFRAHLAFFRGLSPPLQFRFPAARGPTGRDPFAPRRRRVPSSRPYQCSVQPDSPVRSATNLGIWPRIRHVRFGAGEVFKSCRDHTRKRGSARSNVGVREGPTIPGKTWIIGRAPRPHGPRPARARSARRQCEWPFRRDATANLDQVAGAAARGRRSARISAPSAERSRRRRQFHARREAPPHP
jgi:hypothetical protein